MKRWKPAVLLLAFAAGGAAFASDQVYSSADAEPGHQARPARGCIYAGQLYSLGSVMAVSTKLMLKCVPAAPAAGAEREDPDAAPVWASATAETRPPERQRK